MNLITSFLYEHIHSTTASITGASVSILAPVSDILTRILVGVSTGVLVWLITKGISLVFRKLGARRQKK